MDFNMVTIKFGICSTEPRCSPPAYTLSFWMYCNIMYLISDARVSPSKWVFDFALSKGMFLFWHIVHPSNSPGRARTQDTNRKNTFYGYNNYCALLGKGPYSVPKYFSGVSRTNTIRHALLLYLKVKKYGRRRTIIIHICVEHNIIRTFVFAVESD